MRTVKIVMFVPLAAVLVTAGCGTASTTGGSQTAPTTPGAVATSTTSPTACPTANTTDFAKTKLVLHAGLAFGAFHRYLYKPYRAGTFTTGSTVHKVLVIGKAGTAALFVEHEIRLSIGDVNANPTLCNAISKPLSDLETTVAGAITKLKHGDGSGLDSANSSVAAIQSSAATDGLALPDAANPTIS